MKTITKSNTLKTSFLIASFFLLYILTVQTSRAQSIEVKGVVKSSINSEIEPLQGVNIYLKDKSVFTTSNRNGEFSFPKLLQIGDVIIFSYLGYNKKEVKVTKESTNLNIILKEDDNELLGALTSKKRFTSKKKD